METRSFVPRPQQISAGGPATRPMRGQWLPASSTLVLFVSIVYASSALSVNANSPGSPANPNPRNHNRSPRTLSTYCCHINGSRILTSCSSCDFSSLEKIDLESRRIFGIDVHAFDDTPGIGNLTELNLHDNFISSLPGCVFQNLRSLRVLDLGGNSLTTLDANTFCNLPHLQELVLESNSLSSLHNGTFSNLPSLEKLDFRWNSLVDLPATVFRNISSLQELELGQNSILELPDNIFQNVYSLKRLVLQDNDISKLPDTIFHGLRNLQHINLQNNHISELPSEVFRGLSQLADLDLAPSFITRLPDGVFSGLSSLTFLYGSGRTRGESIKFHEVSFYCFAGIWGRIVFHTSPLVFLRIFPN
eukprot:gb/GECG01005495.1/.p1 GENE.gb/GECG01005495.1/~~gb/GECG01005495.1/.p1  ORF type:complete len:362 (+),score=20.40 gb/GECG01005495.1/:1-1086(+)